MIRTSPLALPLLERLLDARRHAEGLLRSLGARIGLDASLAAIEGEVRRLGGSADADALATRLPGGARLLCALAELGVFHLAGHMVRLGPETPAASCGACGGLFRVARTGRPRRFCGATCRQRGHRAAVTKPTVGASGGA